MGNYVIVSRCISAIHIMTAKCMCCIQSRLHMYSASTWLKKMWLCSLAMYGWVVYISAGAGAYKDEISIKGRPRVEQAVVPAANVGDFQHLQSLASSSRMVNFISSHHL